MSSTARPGGSALQSAHKVLSLTFLAAACIQRQPVKSLLGAGLPMLVAGSKSGHVHVVAADSGKALQSMMLGQPSPPRSTGVLSPLDFSPCLHSALAEHGGLSLPSECYGQAFVDAEVTSKCSVTPWACSKDDTARVLLAAAADPI